MNHIICIEHARSRGTYEPITGPELITLMTGPLTLLNQLTADNLAYLKDPTVNGPNGTPSQGGYVLGKTLTRRAAKAAASGKTPKKKSATAVEMLQLRQISSSEFNKQTKAEIEEFTNVTVQQLILNQVTGMMGIEDGKVEDVRFVEDVQLHGYWGVIDISRTVTCVECSDCGKLVTLNALTAHQATLKCMLATGDRDLREQNWQTIQSSHHFQALKTAGIPCDIRPAELAVWVPPWVAEAIKKYEEKEDGYADLKLADFLRKLNPGV